MEVIFEVNDVTKGPELEFFMFCHQHRYSRHKNHVHTKFEVKIIICPSFIVFYADFGSFVGSFWGLMTLQRCPEFEIFDVLTSASVFRHKNHAHAKFEDKIIICLQFIVRKRGFLVIWGSVLGLMMPLKGP